MEAAKLCRLCLKVKKDMQPLEQDLIKQLNEFSECNVKLINGWPDKVCKDCVRDVQYCNGFKKRIENTEKELRQYLDVNESSKEPLSEDDVKSLESDEEETIILLDGSDNLDESNCSCYEVDSDTDEDDIEGDEGNSIIFVDLTSDQVIEVEDHKKPDATSEELEQISESFLESTDNDHPKEAHPNITLRRKRCPINKTTVEPPAPKRSGIRFPKHILLRTFPTFDPSDTHLFQMPVSVQTDTAEPQKQVRKQPPMFVKRSTVHKKGLIPEKAVPIPIEEFLESLDEKAVPIEKCHSEAVKFRKKFKENRDELVRTLIAIYNEKVFSKKFDDVPFRWSNTLRRTGGRCWYRRGGRDNTRKCLIELSEKVLTSPDRVRDVLIHELCHAAVWLFDERHDVHGDYWKYWINLANTSLPVLPKITRCLNYIIHYKYTYKCCVCNRSTKAHSKSKKVENMFCTRCHGPIEVFLNKRDNNGKVTLIPPAKPFGFAKFVKENYKLFKNASTTHVEVMKKLGENYSELSVEEKLQYRKSFGDMK